MDDNVLLVFVEGGTKTCENNYIVVIFYQVKGQTFLLENYTPSNIYAIKHLTRKNDQNIIVNNTAHYNYNDLIVI